MRSVLGAVLEILKIRTLPLLTVLLFAFIGGSGQSASANPLFDHSEKAAMREIREIGESAANLLNVYMDARVTEMLVCSRLGGPISDALAASDVRNDAKQVLARWLETSGAYDAILLLDPKGMCLAAAPESLVSRDFSSEEAFKGAIAGKLTVTDAHKWDILTTLDPNSVGWTVLIGIPMKVKDEISGVLISCVKWKKLRDMMNDIRVGTPWVLEHPTGRGEIWTGLVFLLNRRNEIIIHRSEKYYGVSLRDPEINQPGLDEVIKKKAANHKYEHKNSMTGEKYMNVAGLAYPKEYGNFPGLGWVVVVKVAEDQLIVAPWWMQLFR